ncbi:MAG: tRNA pseudouridine(55) synthase TruB [Bacteroidales bacterium]|nr:tRNA pseudouridine(55) synthase TruB [Bacteroidales bacterium]
MDQSTNLHSAYLNPDFWTSGQVLLFDKPLGWTSFFLVRRVRTLIERNTGIIKLKVGHAGTLDPLATGLMVVATGLATKRIDELQAGDKEYLATVRIGATTPCFDLEKPIDQHFPYEHVDQRMVEEVLERLTGDIDQVPPLFSAKKVEGVRAYEMARSGSEKVLEPKRVRIDEIRLISFTPPDIRLRVRCSRGTYIRALARDIGINLDSGGHLTELRRTRSGDLDVSEALTIEKFEKDFLLLKQMGNSCV